MTTQRTPDPTTDRTTPGQGRDDDNRKPDGLIEDADLGEASDRGNTDDLTGLGRSDANDDEASENR